MVVGMVNRIKQVLRVSLGVYDFYQNPTIEKLARVIAAQGPTSKRRTRVVQLQKGKAERPLYFVYTGLHEARLAELTGKSCEIFGIEVPWPLAWRYSVANNQTFAFPTMDQLVAPYLAALTTHTRSASCVLAGHSFAGLIAFELAQQFQRQGGRVDMVMLFDTWAKYPTVREAAWHRWRQLWKQGPNGLSTDQSLRSAESRLRRSWLIGRWMLGQGARKYFPGFFPKATKLTPMLDEEGVPLPWWIRRAIVYKDSPNLTGRIPSTVRVFFFGQTRNIRCILWTTALVGRVCLSGAWKSWRWLGIICRCSVNTIRPWLKK